MAHNIGQMFSSGAVPWHGLGRRVEGNLTAEEAIVSAGLDWTVDLSAVRYLCSDGAARIMEDRFVSYRTDTGKGLGVVGSKYTQVQNRDCFRIMDAVVGEKLAAYHTAGYLGNGERVWMLMQTPGYIKVKGQDVIEKYFLMTVAHDGSLALSLLFTPIRVVCQNTLNMALSHAGNAFRARHTHSITAKVQDISGIRNQLGILNNQFTLLEELSQRLANKPVYLTDKVKFMHSLFDVQPGDDIPTRTANKMQRIDSLFEYGRGNDLPEIKHSAWALLNAVVEYADYENGGNDMKRAQSTLFGGGARLKQKALELVTAL